jgi:hypothetical protein
MRTTYSSNSELAHIWANNDDVEVYKKANSMSCQFNRLYSYNTCIAEIVGDSVIFNTHSYSNSTCKHQNYARQSIHGKTNIFLDIPSYGLRSLVLTQNSFDELIVTPNHRKIADLLVKAERARLNGEYFKGEAYQIEQNIKAYAELVGVVYTPLDLEQFKADSIELDKARKAQEKIRKAEKIKQQAEDLEKWRKGEDIRSYFEVTALRIKNEEIETSRGARIPLDHAIRAYPLIKRLHQMDATLNLSGHAIKLGHYTVNRIEKNNLIVGCHSIPLSEIYAIAHQLNLEEEVTA